MAEPKRDIGGLFESMRNAEKRQRRKAAIIRNKKRGKYYRGKK